MNKILIVGGGIIGGSLLRVLSKNNDVSVLDNIHIEGFKNESSIDNCNEYELIILCTNINNIKKYLHKISDLNYQNIVMDVGSTKNEISILAKKLNLNYCGLHPMSGNAFSGFEFSSDNMFKDNILFYTNKNYEKLCQQIANKIGSKLQYIDAIEHDIIMSKISHVPQLISIGLYNLGSKYSEYGGPNFKRMTKVSNSPFEMWESIIDTNRTNITNDLKIMRDELNELIAKLEQESNLGEYFTK